VSFILFSVSFLPNLKAEQNQHIVLFTACTFNICLYKCQPPTTTGPGWIKLWTFGRKPKREYCLSGSESVWKKYDRISINLKLKGTDSKQNASSI
jgi:hypothetical protein